MPTLKETDPMQKHNRIALTVALYSATFALVTAGTYALFGVFASF